MFKIIKKSEYEDLYSKFNNEANENRNLIEGIKDLEIKIKELELENEILSEKLNVILSEGQLCYKINSSLFGNEFISIYKQTNNKLEQIRVLDNTKDNLETVKSKIKSCEELDLEFLLNLGVD